MGTFLIQLGTMSLQASAAIIVVLVLRKIFAMLHVSKKYVMLLWMAPFLLLICPWKISSPVGLWNGAPSDYNAEYAGYAIERMAGEFLRAENPSEEITSSGGQISKGTTPDREQVLVEIHHNEVEAEFHPALTERLWDITTAVGIIWLAGMLAFLLYAAISYLRLRKKLQCCVQKADNLYYVDELQVPMVVGVVRPKIYLPSGMDEEHLNYAVEHEKTHIRRKDPLVKPAAYVIACVHWFNPFAWLAYYFFEKDMEMACDEETIRRIGTEKKKEYAAALLQLSVGTRRVFAAPPAFGEGDTKGRIQNVMNDKKTVKAVAVFAVTSGLLVLAVFMTKQEQSAIAGEMQESLSVSEIKQQEDSALLEPEYIEGSLQPGQETAGAEWENQGGLTFDMVREAAADHTLHEVDFHSYSNGEKWQTDDSGSLEYVITFRYNHEGEDYRLDVTYQEYTDRLERIYLIRESDNERCRIYSDNGGSDDYSDQLEILLTTKENVGEWLSVELPEGYAIENYNAAHGLAGGALISPQTYKLYTNGPEPGMDWYYAGFIGKITPAAEVFEFSDGGLKDGQIDWQSHSTGERLDVLDLDWQALLMYYSHDLYTYAELRRLETEGVDTSQIETTSEYWYFFFAKEGEERAYYLSLSAKLFTKEEAIAIAETVDIKE